MLHNKKVIDIELTNPIVMASYVNIFRLYDIWLKYRIKMVIKHNYKLREFVFMWENNLYETHPEFLRFLKKEYNTFEIEPANRRDAFKIYDIQKKGYKRMKKDGRGDLFEPSTFGEFNQMIKHKMLYVRKVNFAIQAYIGVLIMDNKHKFYKYVDPNKKGILIDTVFVDVIYRGLNIQNKLIKHVVDTYKDEYDYAICTIDPNNTKSVDNFTEAGFTVHKENLKLYGKKNRHIYIKHFK